MLTLTLKNIPKDLHSQLKESAERNRRSLNSEILARRVQTVDSEWHVPILWRSEMRSILTGFPSDGSLSAGQRIASQVVLRSPESATASR